MKNFALIGLGGYIAPRHLRAIKDTNNHLSCALDPNDSVGLIDSYFPNADFFTEFERFDRHVDKINRKGETPIDFVSICTPNYLHDSHIRFALRAGADAICEKPLVLNPWNVEALQEFENSADKKVNCIFQLRLHPSIIALKKQIDEGPADKIYDVDLTYITSRGKWYFSSWKSNQMKSGGIATNIGIHFFDMLSWVFGPVQENTSHLHSEQRAAGFLQLKKARVRWFLSINDQDLPQDIQQKQQRTFRSITVDKQELEFSDGFTDLHTLSYEQILAGNGFGLDTAKSSIDTVYQIRTQEVKPLLGDYHPKLKEIDMGDMGPAKWQ